MSLGLDVKLIEGMAQGVILVNREGQVTNFNRAALPWVKHVMAAAQKLRLQVEKAVKGTLRLPVKLDILKVTDPALCKHDVYLCEADAKGYALFVAAEELPASAPRLSLADENFFQFLSAENRREMTQLHNQLVGARASNSLDIDALIVQTDRLSRLLVAFDQLARIHQPDAFTRGERLSLAPLVEEVLREMPRQKCDYFISYPTGAAAQIQSPIYGDAAWLKCMIETLLVGVGEGVPPQSGIELRIRQNGRYSVLSSHYTHASAKAQASATKTASAAASILHLDTDIGAQICRRIAEMHGGQLSISELELDSDGKALRGIESFTVILPTSAPAQAGNQLSCEMCLAARQAERYASDLAFLTPSKPTSEVSETEHQMLSHIQLPHKDS
ncbi:MAG: hypothetical protein WCK83_02650 [Burkholderiales bacterium]